MSEILWYLRQSNSAGVPNPICIMNLKNIFLKLLPELSGASELMNLSLICSSVLVLFYHVWEVHFKDWNLSYYYYGYYKVIVNGSRGHWVIGFENDKA